MDMQQPLSTVKNTATAKDTGTATNLDLDRSKQYEIRIQGHLDDRWSDWFGGMTITLDDSGDTLLTGPVVDQAALYGLLRKVRDTGMSLFSVNPIVPGK